MDLMYLHWLESLRTPFLTDFFISVTALGTGAFYQTALLVIYWCISKRAGTLLLAAHALGAVVMYVWKALAAIPRPYLLDPTLTPLHHEKTFSFPSGHSFNASSVWGGIGWLQGRAGKMLSAVIFFMVMLLIMLSRNYIGVHTPQDVIVGMLLGLGAVIACQRLLAWGESSERSRLMVDLLLVLSAVGFVFFAFVYCATDGSMDKVIVKSYLSTQKGAINILGHILGLVIGMELERRFIRFSTDVSLKYKLIRVIPGLFLSTLLYKLPLPFLAKQPAVFLRMFIFTVFVTAVYPALWKCWEPKGIDSK
ncbi:MAG: phosphatase PAP2 family protein [Selenomonadaceae bacterium]|nr:phosphatase PAP2 family protein [Selenomonadaceae bacterium]